MQEDVAEPVIERMFAAVAKCDMEVFRTCFERDAVIWHNDDELERDLEDTVAGLEAFHALTKSITYRDQRITRAGDQVFSQHVLTADLLSGRQMIAPVLMRLKMSENGRVARLDEYYDSRCTKCLAEEQPVVHAAN